MEIYYNQRINVKRIFRIVVVLAILFYGHSAARADNNYLEQGISYYEYGNYDNSIASLKLIDETTATKKAKTLMHLYLALDYYAKGMNNSMKKELKALYRSNPDFTPNPVIVPPSVISAYSKIKQHTIIVIPTPVKKKAYNYWLRLIPFGVGQFSKGENEKGTILLIAEATALAVNISTYYIRKSKENPDGSYNNPLWARNMQAVQLTAFWLFAGTASYGIIDAFIWKMH